jgi:hypothetical protein
VVTTHLGRFALGERTPCTHWIDGWVCPKFGLEKTRNLSPLSGIEPQPSSQLPVAIRTELYQFYIDVYIRTYKHSRYKEFKRYRKVKLSL